MTNTIFFNLDDASYSTSSPDSILSQQQDQEGSGLAAGEASSSSVVVAAAARAINAWIHPSSWVNREQVGNPDQDFSSNTTPFTSPSEGKISHSSNLKSFSFKVLKTATKNFSPDYLLGEGGFGKVFKGWIDEYKLTATKPGWGTAVAVKRLQRGSFQGHREWLAEINYLGQLYHPNLVKLLGYCSHKAERLLVYEFMSRGSLDSHLFRNPLKRTYLDWETRYQIIGGIARGLLYLHVDSRLRIIHQDLKASNILLDGQMEPKISGFGVARLLEVDQTDGSTEQIVGTLGYIAPEYAMFGQFSVKSDVFSFGVLILEIISGQKSTPFFTPEHVDDLISYARRHWENGTTLELIDPAMKERYPSSEIIRCINIGLLCVQVDVAKRPTMVAVVHMLNTDSVALPLPSTPAFFVNRVQSISPSTADSIN